MASACRIFFAAIIRPRRAFSGLAADPRRFRKGLWAMAAAGILFAASAALLGSGGALVTAPAIVPLPVHNYYFFQMIFALPLFLVLWLMASALGHVLGRAFGGRGDWKTAAAGLGFAFALPGAMVWIPQVVFGGFLHAGMPQAEFMDLFAQPGWLQTGGWAYHGLALAWMLFLSASALRAGGSLSRPRALCAAAGAVALFTAGFLVFIR